MDPAVNDKQTSTLKAFADAALAHYALPRTAEPRMVNLSENATFCIEERSMPRWALRVHRQGYHSHAAIGSELAWLIALREQEVVITPRPVRGRNGELIQIVRHPLDGSHRHVVLFEWESGIEPGNNDVSAFEVLGETTARMHRHASMWVRPPGFERHTWDFETSLGSTPHWGSWRHALGITAEHERLFEQTVETIRRRLERFGKADTRFGLIHGDMRLANLLVDGAVVKVIDFDDCGFGWLLYDCATTVSFFEHKAEVPELLRAWVRGYRKSRELPAEDEAEIPTFVMLRRLVLLAWIGSHAETELARSMGNQYTIDSCRLCEHYLDTLGTLAA